MTFRAERLLPEDVAEAWVVQSVWTDRDGVLHIEARPRVPFRCALSDDRVHAVLDADPTPGHGVRRG